MRDRCGRLCAFFADLFRSVAHDDLGLLAAAIAHYAMLSIIPVMLLAASLLGVVFKNEDTFQAATQMLDQALPVATESVTAIFRGLVAERGPAGGFGVLALLWICARMFITVQRALDLIWGIKPHEKRPFYLQILIALPATLFVGLMAYLSTVVTSIVGSLPLHWPRTLLDQYVRLPDLVTVLGYFLSTLLSIFLMFLIYRLLPSARVRSRSAIVGALVAGVLWELAKQVFTLYIGSFARFDQFYGAMGSLVIIVVWSYVSALVMLFGAEVVECHARWIAATPLLEPGQDAEVEPHGERGPSLLATEPGGD